MLRMSIVALAASAALLVSAPAGAGPLTTATQAAAQASAADAGPFIGEWKLELTGPNGPGGFDLTVKIAEGKVAAEIIGAGMPPQPITDISKTDKSLVLRYSFDYQGNQVAAVVTLTPAADGKTSAEIDFAGGAYLMTGTATKKEAAKYWRGSRSVPRCCSRPPSAAWARRWCRLRRRNKRPVHKIRWRASSI